MKISVTTKKDGFRRAGRAWAGTTVLEQDDLTEKQWQQLDDDAMFSIEEVNSEEVDPLITQLVEAIGKLEKGNKEHWTKSNKPEVKALEKATGININAKQRDQAFKLFNAKKA